jgi:hypothetical protein
MELRQGIRTTPATRAFTETAISDETLYGILDDARFAPSGGNRQGWRVIVLKDPLLRTAVKELYLEGWYQYLPQVAAGLTPFSVVNDRIEEAEVRAQAARFAQDAANGPGGFAENIDKVPALLLVLADLSALATIDRDLDRYSMVGGASIYPFIWNILLAAHDRGLGGVMTTVAVLEEPALRELLTIPDHVVVASLVALGEPKTIITKLRRDTVEDFTTIDTFDGEHFAQEDRRNTSAK